MRLIFMGSPDYAVPSLRAVARAGHDVRAVVTQPPRRAGRGRQVRPTAVAQAAEELQLPVLTPARADEPRFLEAVAHHQPDKILVVAYGQILRRALLQIPPGGCVNAHGSLLPRWRGAAPITAAIRAGDRETGVTIIRMVRRLDAGPMLLQRAMALDPHETAGSLHNKLAQLSADCFVEYLRKVEAREEIGERRQDENEATYAPKLTKEDGRIDWSQSAEAVDRHVRAMCPWPCAFTRIGDDMLRILRVVPEDGDTIGGEPGRVLQASAAEGIVVAAGRGTVRVMELQPASKRPMSPMAYLAGHDLTGVQFQ
jgi:methionyl-tRNA formyltransferase